MFPSCLVVAHLSNEDRRSKTKCIVFPYKEEPTIQTIGSTQGIDLFNYQIVAIPAHIENLSLNSQEYCHLCSTLAKTVLESYNTPKNTRKELEYPYFNRNTDIEDKIEQFVLQFAPVDRRSTAIECPSSSSSNRPAVSFSLWFELFNHVAIRDSVQNGAASWNDRIGDIIRSTSLYQRHSRIYSAIKAWTTWKCASPTLLPLLSDVINEHSDDVATTALHLESFSNHFYLVTLPNGQTTSEHCITHLPMHIGQYRFSPLPISVDLVSVIDPRHSLLTQPNRSIYNTMEVCVAKYYRSLCSSHVSGTNDRLLEQYLDLAEEVVDNKASFEHSSKSIEDKQSAYNFATSLSAKEEVASEILRTVIHRTDFYTRKKLQGTAKCNDKFQAEKTKIDKDDRRQTAQLSKQSRKQLRYARLIAESEQQNGVTPEDVVCVPYSSPQRKRSGKMIVAPSNSSSSGLIAYRAIEKISTKPNSKDSRAQPLRIQDQFTSYGDDEVSDYRNEVMELGVGSYNGFTRVPKPVTDSKRQILYRKPGWSKVPRIVIVEESQSKSNNRKGNKLTEGLEGLSLNVDGDEGDAVATAVVSTNNSIADDVSSISEEQNRNVLVDEYGNKKFNFDRLIKQEPDEDESINIDDISYQDVEVAVVQDDSDLEEDQLKQKKPRPEELLHLNAIDFDYLCQFESKNELQLKKLRHYAEDPFISSATGKVWTEMNEEYAHFVKKYARKKAPTKTLQKICSELIDLHRSELQYSKRILDTNTAQTSVEDSNYETSDSEASQTESRQSSLLECDLMKNANLFSLKSIMNNREVEDVDEDGFLQATERTVRLKAFQELSVSDPTIRSVESVMEALEDVFNTSLVEEKQNIALYHRIACQRWLIKKAQEHMYHFGDVVLKIPEQRHQWKLVVGVRSDFEHLPDRSRQALAFYRRTKSERSVSTTLKRKRVSSNDG